MIKKSILLIIITTMLISACSSIPGVDSQSPTSQDIQYFSSAQELSSFIEEQEGSASGQHVRLGGLDSVAGTITEQRGSVAMEQGQASQDGGADYSSTNVQVEGVDEADIIKTDGEYIYVLSGDSLVITNKGPYNASIIGEKVISGIPQAMFLEGDRLIVFSQDYTEEMHWPEYSIVPQPTRRTTTSAYIYDVSNPEQIRLLETLTFTGGYEQARLKEDTIYLVAQERPRWGGPTPMPRVIAGGEESTIRVGHIGVYEDNYQYTTIASFNTQGEDLLAESFLTGRSNTVYMSHEALYIAHRKNSPWRVEQREQFFEIVVPVLPQELQRAIDAIQGRNLEDEEQWSEISQELTQHMNNLSEREAERFYEQIEDALYEYERTTARERSKSIVHKFSLTNLEHLAQAEINGYLLNQFSLDEHNGNLRVATTVQAWTSQGREQDNNVYVLDEQLEQIGSLEGLAPDERIFSTRFMADRLYMVTFEEIDPFFVIDLADPQNPTVLGELKIPGWSDYLHPYDEHHIIGLGRQTSLSDAGRAQVQGIKLSLFNVEDVTNPREVATYEMGGRGSHSEALHDHKAFLFSKERELLVLPVVEMNDRRSTWEGAYVFRTSTDGFEREARITHRSQGESWWSRTYAVKRSLYIDDSLYTMSDQLLRVHSLDDYEEQSTIELPASSTQGRSEQPVVEPAR